jgi:hypothetical protein
MGDVAALEAAQHVDDGVHLADVGEELVAEALALAGAADQAGDVDELDLGLDLLRRLGDRGDSVEPIVRNRDSARRWARWCRTDSSPPAPRRFRSAH